MAKSRAQPPTDQLYLTGLSGKADQTGIIHVAK